MVKRGLTDRGSDDHLAESREGSPLSALVTMSEPAIRGGHTPRDGDVLSAGQVLAGHEAAMPGEVARTPRRWRICPGRH